LVFISKDGEKILKEFKNKGLKIYKSFSSDIDDSEKTSILESLNIINKYYTFIS